MKEFIVRCYESVIAFFAIMGCWLNIGIKVPIKVFKFVVGDRVKFVYQGVLYGQDEFVGSITGRVRIKGVNYYEIILVPFDCISTSGIVGFKYVVEEDQVLTYQE